MLAVERVLRVVTRALTMSSAFTILGYDRSLTSFLTQCDYRAAPIMQRMFYICATASMSTYTLASCFIIIGWLMVYIVCLLYRL